MRRILLAASLCLLAAFTGISAHASAAGATPASWAGPWHGTLEAGKRQLRLQLTITESADGGLSGQLESLDHAPGQPIALTTLSVADGELRFALPARNIQYEGRWEPAANRFSGVFRQGGSMPLVFTRGPFATAPVVQGLDGTWAGTTRRNGTDMTMRLHVRTGAGGTTASFDAPDMLTTGTPVTALVRKGNQVRFSLPMAGVSFSGQLDGETLTGRWSDGSRSHFQRQPATHTATPPRPQTPRPPFPYREIEAHIPNPAAPSVTLAATLTLPDGAGPFPAAILITGSGPQDRDESAFGHKPFAVLADYLARRGIAVLRHDDRGAGQSSGHHAGATSADFASDTNAAFAWLAAQPGIDPNAIGFIGHSEGGMVGPLAAVDNPQVAWMVLLAAPGVPIAQMLEAQRKALAATQGLSTAELEASEALQAELMRIAGSTLDTESARRALDAVLDDERASATRRSPAAREAVQRQVLDPWFRWFLRYDPTPALAHFRNPILALNGALDRQVVPQQNLAGIRAATAANRDVTTIELPGVNHLLQNARTSGLGEYATLEETIALAALNAIADWITQHTHAKPPSAR